MTISLMSVLLYIGLAVAGVLILYLLIDRRTNIMRDYVVLGLFFAVLGMLGYLMELRTSFLSGKLDAVKFGYLGKQFITPMLMVFVLHYYDFRFKWYSKLLVFAVPLLTLFFIFTCDTNEYYYSSIRLLPNGMLDVEPGPVYYISMLYSLVMSVAYICCCLYKRRKLKKDAKKLNSLLILSTLLPIVSLTVYLLDWTDSIDITPLGIMLGTVVFTYALLKFGMLDKDALLQNMGTALIFINNDNRLIYANAAAYELLPRLAEREYQSTEEDLTPLLMPNLAVMQAGGKSYQRKITQFTDSTGTQGKLITFDDITEMNARLCRDAMTGLYNHAHFYRVLEPSMNQARREHKPLTVSIADIDSFKRINDNYGHANGDIILVALAHTLQEVCKGMDVFRYGGEEFAVIFRADFEKSEEIMQNALKQFSQAAFPFMEGNVTFSFGCAQYDEEESSVALFDRADQLMYSRKKALHEKEREAAAALGIELPERPR